LLDIQQLSKKQAKIFMQRFASLEYLCTINASVLALKEKKKLRDNSS